MKYALAKRAYVFLFFIIGLVFLFTFLFLSMKNNPKHDLEKSDFNIQSYLDYCSYLAIIKSNIKIGLSEEKKEEYKINIFADLDKCMNYIFKELEKKGYYIKKGTTGIDVIINEKEIFLNINYSTKISKNNLNLEFNKYKKKLNKELIISLNDLDKNNEFYSSDKLFKISLDKNLEVYDFQGNKIEKIIIKLEDKSKLKGNELVSNIVYGILPMNLFSSKNIKICFDNELFENKDLEKLKIAWYFDKDEKWGFLEPFLEENYLCTNVSYTTFYGLKYKEDQPENIPSSENNLEDEDFFNLDSNFIPKIKFELYNDNSYIDIFNKINKEMNGPYKLNLNPNCVLGPSSVYCFVGYVNNCGLTAVHCRGDKLNSMPKDKLNILLRHEITHSLQQKNQGCVLNRIASEFGAEYYSGSNYYTIIVNGKKYNAQELGEEMKKLGCSEEEILNTAFCVKGAIENLKNKGCLLTTNVNIGDSIKP